MVTGDRYTSDGRLTQATLEQIQEHKAAGQETLQTVEGWEIAGAIFFMVDYEYVLNDRVETTSRLSTAPVSILSKQQVTFLMDHALTGKQMIHEGRAVYLGREDRRIDGASVQLEKWQVSVPDYGTAIYYRSSP